MENHELFNDHLMGGRSTTLHSRMEDSKTKLENLYLVSREWNPVIVEIKLLEKYILNWDKDLLYKFGKLVDNVVGIYLIR